MDLASIIGQAIRRFIPQRYLSGVAAILYTAKRDQKYDQYREKFDVHPDFRFAGDGIKLWGDGEIHLGEESYVGHYSAMKSSSGTVIHIGDNCAMSHYVFIYTINREPDQDLSNSDRSIKGDVVIGDHCWIGAFTFITEGCSIGEGTVVGAHSVVTHDLPPHAICAGNPVRVIGFKSHLSTDEREALIEEFWDVCNESIQNEFRPTGDEESSTMGTSTQGTHIDQDHP